MVDKEIIIIIIIKSIFHQILRFQNKEILWKKKKKMKKERCYLGQ